MERERKNNCVELIGKIVREAAYSHSCGGEDYFVFFVSGSLSVRGGGCSEPGYVQK